VAHWKAVVRDAGEARFIACRVEAAVTKAFSGERIIR
jgi:hypothetical protein